MATKDELIDEYRDINVDDYSSWDDSVIEDFIFDMSLRGIPLEAENCKYSGFWSQGDGASFVTTIEGDDFDLFCRDHHLYRDYPVLEKAFKAGCQPYIRMGRSSNFYVHENTVWAEFEWHSNFYDNIPREDYDAGYDGEPNIRYHTARVLQNELEDIQTADLDKEICEILRRYMRQLYRKLEDEYDALTDDDAVWDTIVERGLDDELEEEDAA